MDAHQTDASYRIVYIENPEEADRDVIGRNLQKYNIGFAGVSNYKLLCFFLKDAHGEIAGGIFGDTYWDWLYIELMWVKEELRGKGYGRSLLEHAEEEGRKRGARNIFLDTFSFQAPEFYIKCGYRVFGELDDFPPGHRRYFLQKEL